MLTSTELPGPNCFTGDKSYKLFISCKCEGLLYVASSSLEVFISEVAFRSCLGDIQQ